MNTCFENIIGFTKSTCECFNSISADYKKSNSNLYIDALDETVHILPAVKGSEDCGRTMVDLFTNARSNAVEAFMEKVLESVGTRYRVKQNPFIGLIGQHNNTAALNLATDWMGVAYKCQPLLGGGIKIKSIYLSLNETIAEVNVEVWKAYQVGGEYELQEQVTTIKAASLANVSKKTELATPVYLPLGDDSTHIVHYLLLIDRSAGLQPLNNTINCGCSKQKDIEKWLLQGSITGNDKEHIRTSSLKTGSKAVANGIVVDVELKCNDVDFICMNYNANPYVKAAIDHAVWYEAGASLLKGILRSNSLSRFHLTKREQMSTDAVILHNKFKSRIEWIAENLDMTNNTCFVCNTINEKERSPYRTGIKF